MQCVQLMQLSLMILQVAVMQYVRSRFKKKESRNVANYFLLTWQEVNEPLTALTIRKIVSKRVLRSINHSSV